MPRLLASLACFALVFAAGGASTLLLGAAGGLGQPAAAEEGAARGPAGPDPALCADLPRNQSLRRTASDPLESGNADAKMPSTTLIHLTGL